MCPSCPVPMIRRSAPLPKMCLASSSEITWELPSFLDSFCLRFLILPLGRITISRSWTISPTVMRQTPCPGSSVSSELPFATSVLSTRSNSLIGGFLAHDSSASLRRVGRPISGVRLRDWPSPFRPTEVWPRSSAAKISDLACGAHRTAGREASAIHPPWENPAVSAER